MKKKSSQLKRISLLALTLFTIGVFNTNAQECQINISLPQDGSTITTNPITIEGTASIPPETYLWALLGKRGFSGWWPQGNGPLFVFDNEWAVDVNAGTEDDDGNLERGTFYVVFLVVDKTTNGQLVDWVNTAPHKNPSNPPMQLPTSVTECSMKRVSLIRR